MGCKDIETPCGCKKTCNEECLGCPHYHTTDCIRLKEDIPCLNSKSGELLQTTLEKLCNKKCNPLSWVRLRDANTNVLTNVYVSLDCNGKTIFKGFSSRDDTVSGVLWFTLPATFRPATEVRISSSWFHASKGNSVYSCIIVVSTNGNVNVFFKDSDDFNPPSPVVCFENISFYK